MRLLLVALLVVAPACARPPPRKAKQECDRGEPTSAPMLRALVQDRTHTARFRARRLEDLQKRYPDSPEARGALWFALASPSDGGKPMPRALVEAANAIASRGAEQAWVDTNVDTLKRTADDLEPTLPDEAQRARAVAARVEDRAGRVFTLAQHRPPADEVADTTDTGLTDGTRDLDEVLDAYLQCRRAPREPWVRTRDRLKDPQSFQTETRAKAAAAALLKQSLWRFLEATVPEGEKP